MFKELEWSGSENSQAAFVPGMGSCSYCVGNCGEYWYVKRDGWEFAKAETMENGKAIAEEDHQRRLRELIAT